LIIGSSDNLGTQSTGLNVTGTSAPYGFGVTDNGGVDSLRGAKPAVLGHAQQTNFVAGVMGLADAGATAVLGNAIDGLGVLGLSNAGVGVAASSFSSYGIVSDGGKAVARFNGLHAAPPSRGDAHLRGELEVDVNQDLWWCTADGTPGTWRKLAGPGTAGGPPPVPAPEAGDRPPPAVQPPRGTQR